MRSIQRWTFILCVLLVFMFAGLFAGHRDSNRPQAAFSIDFVSQWLSSFLSPRAALKHPIPTLMKDAKHAFIRRLARQSDTLPDAVAEYRRRYGRHPPRGFADWWAFAKENDFRFVDEFDAIVEDLAPFWALSGEQLRRRTYQAGHLPSISLIRIENGDVSEVVEKEYVDDEGGSRSLGFLSLIMEFQHKLPNMAIAINTKAEGRVLVPWEHLRYPDLAARSSLVDETKMLEGFTADWQGDGNVWEAYRRTCPPDTPARQLYTSYRNPIVRKKNPVLGQSRISVLDDFMFATKVDNDFDFCQHPWARYAQGHFFSDWRTIPMLYPIFSPSKAKGFTDIRIPSHYYHAGNERYTYGWDPATEETKEIDDMEVPWDEKSDLIFWRGATTGGGSTPPGFTPTYQRHRFLRMVDESSTDNVTIVHASPAHPNIFVSTTLSAKDVNNEIMDVAFVSSVGTYPGGDSELYKHHRFADSVRLGKSWSYKYLIDLDGMSYSGRFMALLASDSAVLKSTVYKEFFSDWIQPWLHYIPVSSSYHEIYNVHAYFSGPSPSTLDAANQTVVNQTDWEAVRRERDRELRQIAAAGRQWKNTIGRTVDMQVYVYRLCLEYARLWEDDRDSMDFVL